MKQKNFYKSNIVCLSFVLVLFIGIISLFSVVFFQDTKNIVFAADGSCGANAEYTISGTTLTISGTGDMADFYSDSAPWNSIKSSITTVVIESGITRIGDYAFYEFTNLSNLSIASTVTTIGSNAFRNCTSLTEIIIPQGVTTIENAAFSACENITSITLPQSLSEVELDAFGYISCDIHFLGSLADWCSISYEDVWIGSDDGSVGYNLYIGANLLTELNPTNLNGITSINPFVFFACHSLTSVEIPDTVTEIGAGAFIGCVNLETVILGEGITEVEFGAFAFTGVDSVELSSTIDTIGPVAFFGCSSLRTVVISSTTPPTLVDMDGVWPFPETVTTFVVPEGTEATYESSTGWSTYVPTGSQYVPAGEVSNTGVVADVIIPTSIIITLSVALLFVLKRKKLIIK